MNWDDEEPDARPARDSFTPLFGQPEQNGYLPSEEDQSWREREAARLGYFAPRDEAWRARDVSEAAETFDTGIAEPDLFEAEPVEAALGETEAVETLSAEPVSADTEIDCVDEAEELATEVAVADHGDFRPQRAFSIPEQHDRSGKSLLLALVATVGGVALLLYAFPQSLTANFWTAQFVAAKIAVDSPAKPVRTAPVMDTPALAPSLATEAPVPVAPPEPTAPVPAQPDPIAGANAPVTQDAPPTVLPKPDQRSRLPAAVKPADNNAGGFYAMVPGPDGTMTSRYFPADPGKDAGSTNGPAVPKETGAGEEKGVYALAPGPDGTLKYQYFPPKRSR
ncbi:MAG TPA: hypothetical protein VGM68_06675 [Rhizomicrobium sp.]|jgi:hypothetical protein